MGSPGNQQIWAPYETTKDCSQGFCSIYCPQWCYIIFPPPPPFNFSEEPSGPSFSPLVIAIIGILGSAFLLVTYYTIVSRYCGNFDSLRRRLNRDDRVDVDPDDHINDPSRNESWQATTLNGLEESIIKSIGVCKYKRGDGLVEGTDCAVCLGEFRDDESLRLLPKCSHAFHVSCIDTWLKSHSNCPLCRSNIVLTRTAAAQPELPAPTVPERSPSVAEIQHDQEMVVVVVVSGSGSMEDQGRGLEEEEARTRDAVATSNPSIADVLDRIQPIRRSVSMDAASCRDRISIADVLGINMEDDLLDSVDAAESSRGFREEYGKSSRRSRVLHSVMSPVPMKRSFSSGRFCFTRQGTKGNNFILPV